jgi:hypothetical protein
MEIAASTISLDCRFNHIIGLPQKDGNEPYSEDDKEESKDPDYDEDKDQLEEEQEGETAEVTVNQVF